MDFSTIVLLSIIFFLLAIGLICTVAIGNTSNPSDTFEDDVKLLGQIGQWMAIISIILLVLFIGGNVFMVQKKAQYKFAMSNFTSYASTNASLLSVTSLVLVIISIIGFSFKGIADSTIDSTTTKIKKFIILSNSCLSVGALLGGAYLSYSGVIKLNNMLKTSPDNTDLNKE